MNKLILTDVDLTLLDFLGSFRPWAEEQGYSGSGNSYSFAEYYGIDEDEALELTERFCHSPAFAELKPVEHAVDAVRALHRAGYDFVGISACADSDEALRLRTANLEHVFGIDWPAVHLVGIDQDKSAHLSAYDEAIWVDDHPHHAMMGSKIGHDTFLIDTPYNQGYFPGVTRVKDWREIRHALIKTWED